MEDCSHGLIYTVSLKKCGFGLDEFYVLVGHVKRIEYFFYGKPIDLCFLGKYKQIGRW